MMLFSLSFKLISTTCGGPWIRVDRFSKTLIHLHICFHLFCFVLLLASDSTGGEELDNSCGVEMGNHVRPSQSKGQLSGASGLVSLHCFSFNRGVVILLEKPEGVNLTCLQPSQPVR